MNPLRNPYAPGAGTPPPILAGRDDLAQTAELALARVKGGLHAKAFIAVGLRGVGKTVVLNKVLRLADDQGYESAYIEAYDEIRLPDALAKALRPIVLRLNRSEAALATARRAMGALRSFAAAFKISIGGVDIGVSPEEGTADSGDLSVRPGSYCCLAEPS